MKTEVPALLLLVLTCLGAFLFANEKPQPPAAAVEKIAALEADKKDAPEVDASDFVRFDKESPVAKLRTATITYSDGKGVEIGS
jgi:hypothetical protein